ncbi:MAG: cupin domain-containing protein [Rhodospirillales bacterium]
MLIGIAHKRRGTGSKFHTHPNEQFNFVLKGTLRVDIGDQTFYCPAGSVAHIPAGVVHSTCATEDEDVMFFVCKDTRHGISGPPIDGKEDGARYLPGFEPTDEQLEKDADFDPIPTKS